MHQCPQLLLGRYCCIVREQHVPDEGFTNFFLGSEAAKIEKAASNLVHRQIPSDAVLKEHLVSRALKIPTSMGARRSLV